MHKLSFIFLFIILASSCTLRKEGGSWSVKRTIVDEIQDGVQGTKELITDLDDANTDLSNTNKTDPDTEEENQPSTNVVNKKDTTENKITKH